MVPSFIEVHQFSRAFINIHKNPNYGWVSGGYDTNNPIFRESTPVPEVIVDEVRKRNFALNDNYQPRQNELALIARTIYDFDHDQKICRNGYAVLAVANLQNDGGRPLIGYRYFWLNLSQAIALKYPNIQPRTKDFQRLLLDGIDGVWTLVDCWLRCGQAKFSMGEDDRHPYTIYSSYQIHEYPKIQQDSYKTNQIILRFNALLNKINDKTIKDFHSKIVDLKQKTRYSLSWAYNVKVLENPGEFLGIALTNDAPRLSPISFQPARVETPESSLSEPDVTPVMLSSDSGEIKQALKELTNKANSSDFVLKDIIKKILDYRASDRSQWGEVHIDKTMAKNSFIYNAILSVFCPNLEHLHSWCENQFLPRVDQQAVGKKSGLWGRNKQDDPELITALKIQRLIFDGIQEHPQRKILDQDLLTSIYQDLQQILLRNNEFSPVYLYLLSQDTIWSSCLKSYMDECLGSGVPGSRKFVFILNKTFWEKNERLSRNKEDVEFVLRSDLKSFPFNSLHLGFIDRVIDANSLAKSHRRQRYSHYKELANLANDLEYPEFYKFFIRLSGIERDEDAEQPSSLDKILFPRSSRAKKNDDDLRSPIPIIFLILFLIFLTYAGSVHKCNIDISQQDPFINLLRSNYSKDTRKNILCIILFNSIQPYKDFKMCYGNGKQIKISSWDLKDKETKKVQKILSNLYSNEVQRDKDIECFTDDETLLLDYLAEHIISKQAIKCNKP